MKLPGIDKSEDELKKKEKRKLIGRRKQNKDERKSKAAISYSDLNSGLQLNNNIIYWRSLKCREGNPH